jgi:predicted DNA-binding protein
VLGGRMAKKSANKIAGKDAEQYMLRLPAGLRDQVARRAAENGRSMNTEIIDAIEKHLEGTDRISQLWEMFQKHRENIEAIPLIWAAVENIESHLERSAEGETPAGLSTWRRQKEHAAREAARPPIPADQARQIRALIKETGADEPKLLRLLKAPTIEEIKDFERVVNLLEQRRGSPDGQ